MLVQFGMGENIGQKMIFRTRSINPKKYLAKIMIRRKDVFLLLLSLKGKKILLNINSSTDMTEQKRNVDESSKSPPSRKRKRYFTPTDEKFQHLTTTSNTSLETDVFLNRQEPS